MRLRVMRTLFGCRWRAGTEDVLAPLARTAWRRSIVPETWEICRFIFESLQEWTERLCRNRLSCWVQPFSRGVARFQTHCALPRNRALAQPAGTKPERQLS